MRNFFIISVLAIVLAVPAKADEGMWLPALIRKLNIGDMQKQVFGSVRKIFTVLTTAV